jgi:GMP synthase (glutamine-hydrolysing)
MNVASYISRGSKRLAERFDAAEFIRSKLSEVNSSIGGESILLACSGGLCSNVMATIVLKASGGSRIIPLFIDTGFMRKNEVERVKETLTRAPLKLNLKTVDARKQFMKPIERADTATEKRNIFYEVFWSILQNSAEKEGAGLIVLGTSATGNIMLNGLRATSSSKRSTQIMEPLITLNRCQVLEVAQKLDLPPRLADVNPFPAPGLMIRAVGKVNDEKIREVREATEVVEEELQYVKPSQYFAAVIEDKDDDEPKIDRVRERISDLLDVGASQVEVKVPRGRVAGFEGEERVYGKASASRVTLLKSKELLEPDYDDLASFPAEFRDRHKDFTRSLYSVTKKPRNGKYIAIIRAVLTNDFKNATIARLDWTKLYAIASRIMNESSKISSVYYDATSKPPAAIEFE